MQIKLKNSLTLDTDQLSCSEFAKCFIEYAFFLDGNQEEHDFDAIMMRFVHALDHVVREGHVHIGGSRNIDFDVTYVPEAISALAAAYPELAINRGFAKWLSCCNTAHKKHLPSAEKFSVRARVAACWWGERIVRPGAHTTVEPDKVDARLRQIVENRALIDIVYARFLDAFAGHIDKELQAKGVCIIHWHKDWMRELTDWLDKKLGEFGEGSGGTWFLTEEVMKVTPTRVLVTMYDCEYCELFPGEHLVEIVDDDAIYLACGRHRYGKFISHVDFFSDR